LDQQWISNGSCKSKDLDYYFNLALDYEYREIAQLLIAAGADGLVIECPYCGTMPVPSDLYNAKLCDHVVCVFDADKNMINEELIELPFAEYASTTYRSDIDEIFLTLSHVAELYDHDFSQPPSHYDFLNALCKDSSAIKSDQVGDLLFVYAKDDNVIDKHL
jgi:hypothetical protein